ncbi:glycosyltransferase family 2 protein [Thioclava electrotropha]|uniref:Glycosyltransferase family 2 protein n=1 Tax=Thioclava electrotropha TaxID=1549850 RepID=A0ABX6YUT5_9RHOB|nr:glycosyltransferase family 2 protein [Thioclava electrotropha]QPZ91611.1 glycosyltransferase family 2 protein [Thioclava electrotropha]
MTEVSSNSSAEVVEQQLKWLSILIPTHNAEPYLAECLGSVLSNIGELSENAAAGIELIVLDDASTDGSRKIIDEFRFCFPDTVSVIEHDNSRGVSAARNSLIAHAKGEYIWYIDADDLMAPGVMIDLLDIMHRIKPDYIMCDYATFSNEPTGLSKKARKSTFNGPSNVLIEDCSTALSGLFETGALHPWSKIHRRSLYADTLTFPVGRIYEDLLVMPLLALRAASFFHVKEAWIFHRKHHGSLIGSRAIENTEDKCFALVTLAGEFEKEGGRLSRGFRSAFYYFMGRHLRVLFKQLVRSADFETAKEAYSTCSKMLSSTTIRIDGRVRNSLIRRGRFGKLTGLLLWKRRAQKRFE